MLSKICNYLVGFHRQIRLLDTLLNEKEVILNLCQDLSIVVEKLKRRYKDLNPSRSLTQGKTNAADIALFKELTIKSMEPQIEKLILKHKREIQEMESSHSIELSNIQFHLRNTYEDKIKSINERNILEVMKSRSLMKNELLHVVQETLEQQEQRDTCRQIQLLDKFKPLKSNVYLLRSEITTLRENFMRNSAIFLSMFRSSYLNITEVIEMSYISNEKKFRDQWLHELETVKNEVGIKFAIEFDEKELLIIKSLKKNHEEEIEIIIENLENRFNDERKRNQFLHNESISNLKYHYENKISRLVQTNVHIESKFSDLSARFQKLNEDYIQTKDELGSLLEKNSLLHSELALKLNTHVGFESLDYSPEGFSALVMENSHLKHYIKELDIKTI
ncbi:hypothetical protein LOD99_5671 [Oopsacas minuta]|uniref:Uncharacterized protein n=1 Tax=Oopsacas minuta TaxID=111878 RepID=A0AAV7JRD2_9METZ|nr:hypothetical protein LOD99_5671 [Oopsacas minuta]